MKHQLREIGILQTHNWKMHIRYGLTSPHVTEGLSRCAALKTIPLQLFADRSILWSKVKDRLPVISPSIILLRSWEGFLSRSPHQVKEMWPHYCHLLDRQFPFAPA